MNRKIYTAIATLIAAFSVAVAVAPVASAGKVLAPTAQVCNDIKIGNHSQ